MSYEFVCSYRIQRSDTYVHDCTYMHMSLRTCVCVCVCVCVCARASVCAHANVYVLDVILVHSPCVHVRMCADMPAQKSRRHIALFVLLVFDLNLVELV